ncbi:MAG: type II toxin-antitoxin system Phd/YefM family antitoxin [Cryomorphaceae bacterium]|nr:type II toxin-antitoxin system prevent-host-death family antitoxin [Flavobacteriales bacterium]
MEVTTYSDFKRNIKAYLEKVLSMGAPLFVTRSKGNDVVVLSKSEYNSMLETFHLLKSPKNAERLMEAVKQDKQGGGSPREILE